MTLEILYEDNHCLAVHKPAGLPVQGGVEGVRSLVDEVADDLKVRYRKPGNVFVGLVHRIDQPVSGVVLVAKTSKAAARLSEQFRDGKVEKVYWAWVEGRGPAEAEGQWRDWLRKDSGRNVVEVVPEGSRDSKEASLAFRVLDRDGGRCLIELRPLTGRSHQLRVQLSERGLPIVGDMKYGSRSTLRALDGGRRIALHARRLTFRHPTRGEAIEVSAEAPGDWPGGGSSRGSRSG